MRRKGTDEVIWGQVNPKFSLLSESLDSMKYRLMNFAIVLFTLLLFFTLMVFCSPPALSLHSCLRLTQRLCLFVSSLLPPSRVSSPSFPLSSSTHARASLGLQARRCVGCGCSRRLAVQGMMLFGDKVPEFSDLGAAFVSTTQILIGGGGDPDDVGRTMGHPPLRSRCLVVCRETAACLVGVGESGGMAERMCCGGRMRMLNAVVWESRRRRWRAERRGLPGAGGRGPSHRVALVLPVRDHHDLRRHQQ